MNLNPLELYFEIMSNCFLNSKNIVTRHGFQRSLQRRLDHHRTETQKIRHRPKSSRLDLKNNKDKVIKFKFIILYQLSNYIFLRTFYH